MGHVFQSQQQFPFQNHIPQNRDFHGKIIYCIVGAFSSHVWVTLLSLSVPFSWPLYKSPRSSRRFFNPKNSAQFPAEHLKSKTNIPQTATDDDHLPWTGWVEITSWSTASDWFAFLFLWVYTIVRLIVYVCMYIYIYIWCIFQVYLSICLSICLSVCLSVCLSICLSVYLSICLSVYLSIYLSVCLSVCLSICLSVYLSICLSVYLSMCLSIYLTIYLSTYLPIYLSIYLSN